MKGCAMTTRKSAMAADLSPDILTLLTQIAADLRRIADVIAPANPALSVAEARTRIEEIMQANHVAERVSIADQFSNKGGRGL